MQVKAALVGDLMKTRSMLIRTLGVLLTLVLAPRSTAQSLPTGLDPQNTILIDTKRGRIFIKLKSDIAPKHAERIKTLAREKFFDNVPFHRVIPGFMAQTGDGQYGNGTGSSNYPNLPAEFSSVPFRRGIVGMARSGNSIDSANSQFFIMYVDKFSLNQLYTVIGEVVASMGVVDQIKKGSAANGTVADPDLMLRVQVAADAGLTSDVVPPVTPPTGAGACQRFPNLC